MLLQIQISRIFHNILNRVVDKLVEGVQLLPNESPLLKKGCDYCPAILLGELIWILLISILGVRVIAIISAFLVIFCMV